MATFRLLARLIIAPLLLCCEAKHFSSASTSGRIAAARRARSATPPPLSLFRELAGRLGPLLLLLGEEAAGRGQSNGWPEAVRGYGPRTKAN